MSGNCRKPVSVVQMVRIPRSHISTLVRMSKKSCRRNVIRLPKCEPRLGLAQHHHSPLATKGFGHDFHHPTIERREKPIVRNRHGDEVCIGDLSVPYESIGGNSRVVRHRDSIIPKAVTGGRGEIAKEDNGLGGRPGVWNGPTVRRDSNESRLGGRCGRPAFAMGS